MKVKLNWPFWVLVALAYNGNGLKGVMWLFVILSGLMLLSAIIWSFTSEFRNYLIKDKGFEADGKFIQFCCKRGLHTWGDVVEDKPKTERGEHYLKVYHLKFGERKSLCCDKTQVVDSPEDGRHWFELKKEYYGLREDCLK